MNATAKQGHEPARSGSNGLIFILTTLLLVCIVLSLFSFFHVSTQDAYAEQYLLRATEQKVLAQQIVRYGLSAAKGDEESFTRLKQARARYDELLGELKNGQRQRSLPSSPQTAMQALAEVEKNWLELRANMDEILAGKESILSVKEYTQVISDSIPELLEPAREMAAILVKGEAPPSQVYLASRQIMLAQSIEHHVNLLLAGREFTSKVLEQIGLDAEYFGQAMKAFDNTESLDPEATQALVAMASFFVPIGDHVSEIIHVAPAVLPALEAANKLEAASETLDEAAMRLVETYSQSPGRLRIRGIEVDPLTPIYLGALAAAVLVLLGFILVLDAKRRGRLSEQHNNKNQQAIQRLLEEIDGLANGDLRVSASVTEGFAGAIAGAINSAVAALRDLVVSINGASGKVLSSVRESQAVAMHLAEANEHQADQISRATQSIGDMTQAIDQMANDAKESAAVAQHSVEIAAKGTGTVRRTIEGMDLIREQIQETSKRIKRLGESSQEIGDIVELIEDIADQTNILALNAAMQAAMAGDAGRGFVVVADEVQRLAERSTHATKQIETLVKTIQADTQEAAASMETSTAGVVAGANLAEDAGEVLREIEHVSHFIAELTGKMAGSAQQQSSEAMAVNDTMRVIQEIVTQTSEGAAQATSSIGALADRVDELQQSVARLRLPE